MGCSLICIASTRTTERCAGSSAACPGARTSAGSSEMVGWSRCGPRGAWAADAVLAAREHSARSRNIAPVDAEYSPLAVCHGRNGMQQWQVDLAEAGKRYIHVYYASGQKRPVTLTSNGRRIGQFLGRATGGFHKEHLAWETIGPFDFRKGRNTKTPHPCLWAGGRAGDVFCWRDVTVYVRATWPADDM